MEFHDLFQYCFQLKGATETYPFDNKTLVMKVMGKMFLLVDVHDHKRSISNVILKKPLSCANVM